jgi:hypothetical protein
MFKIGDMARMIKPKDYYLFKYDINGDETQVFHLITLPKGTQVKFIPANSAYRRSTPHILIAQITAGAIAHIGKLILLHETEWQFEGFVPMNTENSLGNFPRKTGEEV